MEATDRLEARKKVEVELIRRAQDDEAFRSQLLSDPKAAIEAHLGQEIPPGFEIKAIEETPNSFFLIVPAKRTGGELSDQSLDAVSGGVGCDGCGCS